MKRARTIISLFLSLIMLFGIVFMIQDKLETIPEFHHDQISREQVIRNRSVPIKETAVMQKTSAREISYRQRNQNQSHLLILVCILVLAGAIWKCPNTIFAHIWYSLEQYRIYMCRILVRRGPPLWKV